MNFFHFFQNTPLRGVGGFWYTTHSFARKGRTSLFESRQLRKQQKCLCGAELEILFSESLILAQNERW